MRLDEFNTEAGEDDLLSEVNQSEIRRLKIKQWLLLLLRTLAVIAIAMAMARPAVRGSAGLTSGAATTVVVLVDRSGSMAADAGAIAGGAEGAGDLMSAARRVLEDLLVTLGPADELLLVPYDRAPLPINQNEVVGHLGQWVFGLSRPAVLRGPILAPNSGPFVQDVDDT